MSDSNDKVDDNEEVNESDESNGTQTYRWNGCGEFHSTVKDSGPCFSEAQVNIHSESQDSDSKVEDKKVNQANKSSDTSFTCRWNGCGDAHLTLKDLVGHVNKSHVEGAQIELGCQWDNCPKKGLSLSARYKLVVHMRIHTHERPYVCTLCNKSFSRVENLRIHTRSHTGERPYTCPIEGCTKAYANSSDRHKHIRTHFTKCPYVCRFPGCGKSYTDPSSLRKHIKIQGHLRSIWYSVEKFHEVQGAEGEATRIKVEPEDDSCCQEYYGIPDNMIKVEMHYPSEEEPVSPKRVCSSRSSPQLPEPSLPPSSNTVTFRDIPAVKTNNTLRIAPPQLGGYWASHPGDNQPSPMANGLLVPPYLWFPYCINTDVSPVIQCPRCKYAYEPIVKRTVSTQTTLTEEQSDTNS